MDSLVLDVGQESRTELATATAGAAGRRTRGVEIAASDLWQTVKGGKAGAARRLAHGGCV